MKIPGKIIKFFVFGVTVFILISDFTTLKDVITNSLMLWCTTLIPSLFPYLVISQYIINSNGYNTKSMKSNLLSRILKTDYYGIRVFFTSLICGYPSGAICVSDLYRNSLITKDNATRLICYTNNAGPLFLISAIGTGMLNNTYDGIALYIIQLISCICYATFSSGYKDNNKHLCSINTQYKCKKKDITECINTATNTIISIGGFVTATAVICEILLTLCKNTPFIGELISYDKLKIIIFSFFEVSNSALLISQLPENAIRFAFLCSVISWSGVCVLWQVKSSLPEDISVSRYIYAKSIQSVTSFFLGYVYKISFDFNSSFPVKYNLLFISLILTIFIFACYIFKKTIKKVHL